MRAIPFAEHLVEALPAEVVLHHAQDPGTELIRDVGEDLAHVCVARGFEVVVAMPERFLHEPLSSIEELVERTIAVALLKEAEREVVGEAFAHPKLAAVFD